MTTKFYLDFRNKAKDGKGNLLLQLFSKGKSISIPMSIRLTKDEWNGSGIVNRPDSRELNVQITGKKNDIDRKLALLGMGGNLDSMSLREVKEYLEPKQRKALQTTNRSVKYLFNTYMERDLRSGTKSIYNATLCKILDYGGENITIDKINYEWLIGFEKYLSKTQSVNGRGAYLKFFRTICNYAVHLEMINKNPFRDFSVKSEQTRKRSVSVETLRELYLTPTYGIQQRYKDYFFLMFFLIGINVNDLLNLKPNAIIGNRLEYIRAKTKKKYSIKLEPEALEIINKYRGKEYLIDALEDSINANVFTVKMNSGLGRISRYIEVETPPDSLFGETIVTRKKVPVIPGCTTYYARHSWATIAYELEIPIDTISQALGHSFGNRTTMIYIRFNQDKVDEANRKVIDYFFSGIKNTVG